MLSGLADKLARFANDASAGKTSVAQEQVRALKKELEDTVLAAEDARIALDALQNIQIGAEIKTVEALNNFIKTRQQLQQNATDNPLVQSVVPETAEQNDRERIVQPPEIVQVLKLDTREADREMEKFMQRATQPIERKIYTNEAGNSFTDRPGSGFSELSLEALARGKRR